MPHRGAGSSRTFEKEGVKVPRGSVARTARIPYITQWDSELAGPESDLVVDMRSMPPRLAYRNERPMDRDGSGVLWARVSQSPRVGKPDFATMHSGRQYECMYALKCQVCGRAASKTQDGYLFLIFPQPSDPASWPEGARVNQPPVCLEHAQLAMRLCPRNEDFLAVRARVPKLWGVSGVLYRYTEDGWESDTEAPDLRYGDERLNAMLASHLVRELRNVTVVEL
jgi:hypothetical protein